MTQPDILALLQPDARDRLFEGAGRLGGQRGDVLVSKGDEVSGALVVSDGTVRVYAMSSEGRQVTLYRLAGQGLCLLSLNSLLTGGPYPAWVAVESETVTVTALPGPAFRRLFAEDAEVRELVLSSLTAMVGGLMMAMDEALLSRLSDRVMNFLNVNADAQGRVAITHQGLADHLGVTREAISRQLGRLKRQGRIDAGRNIVRLKA